MRFKKELKETLADESVVLQFKIKKKLTLIEVLLSFALISFLMLNLFFIAGYMWRSTKQCTLARNRLLEQELFWTRLQDAFSKCTLIDPKMTYGLKSSEYNERNDPALAMLLNFSGQSQSIAFNFHPLVSDQGVKNYIQHARLFLLNDKLIFEQGPSLALQSSEICEKFKHSQTWRSTIQAIHFKYLHIQNSALVNQTNNLDYAQAHLPDRPQPGWNAQWLPHWRELPHAILLEITTDTASEQWPIWLNKPLVHTLIRNDFEN